jgi:hypothetical protein
VRGYRIAGSLILALLVSAPAFSADVGLEFYSQRINRVTQDLVDAIRPTLDPRAQKAPDDTNSFAALVGDHADARRVFAAPPHR